MVRALMVTPRQPSSGTNTTRSWSQEKLHYKTEARIQKKLYYYKAEAGSQVVVHAREVQADPTTHFRFRSASETRF